MAPGRKAFVWLGATVLLAVSGLPVRAEPAQVNNIHEAFAWLQTCWKPPPNVNPDIEITVIVSFNRDGHIFGQPKVTYQSEQGTDDERLAYRVAAMEALQRCTPMPFTESMAGAVAGRPFAVRFRNRKPPPQPAEKRAWLTPQIL
jgi:hypothetical protein